MPAILARRLGASKGVSPSERIRGEDRRSVEHAPGPACTNKTVSGRGRKSRCRRAGEQRGPSAGHSVLSEVLVVYIIQTEASAVPLTEPNFRMRTTGASASKSRVFQTSQNGLETSLFPVGRRTRYTFAADAT
jgi:hypothetical protein